MKPANVFQLEWALAASSSTALLMRFGFTLLLGAPFVLAAMPAEIKAVGIMMLILFTSFFGAAVSMVRRRTEGHLLRLSLLPVPRWLERTDFILSGSLIDLFQTVPLLILFIWLNGSGIPPVFLLRLFGLLLLCLLLLNLLGTLLGLVMRSNPEVHLTAAVTVAFMAVISGLIPVSDRIATWLRMVNPGNPLHHLARALTAVAEGSSLSPQGQIFPWLALFSIIGAVFLLRAWDLRIHPRREGQGS